MKPNWLATRVPRVFDRKLSGTATIPIPLRYFSAYSGIGGFECAFPRQWECVGYAETDPTACAIYTYHFHHTNYENMETLNPKDLPEFDLLNAGFPCQPFSKMGKQKGLNDPRWSAIFDIGRILAVKKPKFFLLENVKGLLFHDRWNTFQTILAHFSALGYGVEWQVLNSQDFGVPQSRERIFLVGYLGGLPRFPVFPFRFEDGSSSRRVPTVEGPEMKTRQDGKENAHIVGWSPCFRNAGDGPVDVIPVSKPRDNKNWKDINRFRQPGSSMFTLTTHNNVGVLLPEWARMLTPKEWERLQGFPDDWTRFGKKPSHIRAVISDTQRRKVLGNAVTVPVVRAIAQRLSSQLEASRNGSYLRHDVHLEWPIHGGVSDSEGIGRHEVS